MDSYGGGRIETSSGATFYAIAVAPGGCPFPTYNGYDGNLCAVVSFENLKELGVSGGGNVLACGTSPSSYSGLGGYTRVEAEICTGTVMWAPDTFLFHGPEATFYLPETCTLFEED
jgi:hypothetical protein